MYFPCQVSMIYACRSNIAQHICKWIRPEQKYSFALQKEQMSTQRRQRHMKREQTMRLQPCLRLSTMQIKMAKRWSALTVHALTYRPPPHSKFPSAALSRDQSRPWSDSSVYPLFSSHLSDTKDERWWAAAAATDACCVALKETQLTLSSSAITEL